MLIDEVEVTVKAGNGGNGAMSFGKSEKSGPDGGNGGDGGDVYIMGSSDLTLLAQFRGKELVEGQSGVHGKKEKRHGKNAKDLILNLPVGSFLTDANTGETFELNTVGEEILLCKGGEGGTGNFDLRSSRNVTPTNTIPPTPGQSRSLKISLRFIADYGLVGLPSSGKSSLINELTNAKVKTADYHFTTLSPNLGVLPNKRIIADIPGLIEGASEGRGLGTKFLKHIQKVSLFLHCIASNSPDPVRDYQIIRTELGNFDKELLNKKEIILITKSDLVNINQLQKIKNKLTKLNKNILATSIHDEASLNNLLSKIH